MKTVSDFLRQSIPNLQAFHRFLAIGNTRLINVA